MEQTQQPRKRVVRRPRLDSEARPRSSSSAANSNSTGGGGSYDKLLKTRGAGESKWSKFLTRLWTGWVMIGIFLAILKIGHVAVVCFIVALQARTFFELANVRYQADKAKAVPLFRTLQWCWFVAAMFFTYGHSFLEVLSESQNSEIFQLAANYHGWVSFGGYVACFVATVLSLKKDYYEYQMEQLTWTVVIVAMVVFQMSFIVHLVMAGLFWFLLPASLIICNDCWAYFCGYFFGRKFTKRTFLRLSPNKTWEGFVGGLIFTVIFAYFVPILLNQEWLVCPVTNPELFVAAECTPSLVFQVTEYTVPLVGWTLRCMPIQLHAVVLGVFASIVAPFGGFFASAIKRAYNIKDFDTLIPGHGGVMDRLDCQLVMMFCTYVHYTTWVAPAAMASQAIAAGFSRLAPEDQLAVLGRLQAIMGGAGGAAAAAAVGPVGGPM